LIVEKERKKRSGGGKVVSKNARVMMIIFPSSPALSPSDS